MILFKQAPPLTQYLIEQKEQGKKIGFAPTMGALHKGHISLIEQAKSQTDITVCSIFVNPTQFNNPDDLAKYPVTLEKDIQMLIENGCDILFIPSRDEIYPAGYQASNYNLGNLENLLEGFYRPGHFQGVCQVVDRLLQIVNPHQLFLGQKDYQQCQVIQKLLDLTNRNSLSLQICPTIREEDGLAMSSRNLRLNKEQRAKATALYQVLSRTKDEYGTKPLEKIKHEAVETLTQKGFQVDYFEIADAADLATADKSSKRTVALVAAYLDEIRLIDNLPLN